jgi:ferredoxin
MKRTELDALYGNAAGRCAKCRIQITKTDTPGRAYAIGDKAHIVGKSKKGPRGDSSMSAADRASAANHVLLCANCHREIDRDKAAWRPERLLAMKAEHEDRVRLAGECIPMSELAGTIEVEAVDVDEATGADIEAPTRIAPGTRVGVRGSNVGTLTGVKIRVGGN